MTVGARTGFSPEESVEVFERHRGALQHRVRQILGSAADAEDVVQDVWGRWAVHGASVSFPRAWLHRVAVRIALDRLRGQQRRPELLADLSSMSIAAPVEVPAVDLADDIAEAVGHLIGRLSPLERATLVLRRCFAWPYDVMADALQRSQPALRQLDHRAARHLARGVHRFPVDPRQVAAACGWFVAAGAGGDVTPLIRVLSPGVAFRAPLVHPRPPARGRAVSGAA